MNKQLLNYYSIGNFLSFFFHIIFTDIKRTNFLINKFSSSNAHYHHIYITYNNQFLKIRTWTDIDKIFLFLLWFSCVNHFSLKSLFLSCAEWRSLVTMAPLVTMVIAAHYTRLIVRLHIQYMCQFTFSTCNIILRIEILCQCDPDSRNIFIKFPYTSNKTWAIFAFIDALYFY